MEIDVKYKRHPRMLELRVIMIFNNLVRNYNYNRAVEILEALCMMTKTNFKNIMTIINNDYNIRRLSKTDKERWLQELIFMGALYNESKHFVSERWLIKHKTYLYNMPHLNLDLDKFVTKEWIDKLTDNVVICAIPHQKLEAERFIDGINDLLEVMGNVSIPKTKV